MPSPSRSLANGVLAPKRAADAMANGAPGQAKKSRRIERLLRAQIIAGCRLCRNRLDPARWGWEGEGIRARPHQPPPDCDPGVGTLPRVRAGEGLPVGASRIP